MSAGATAAIPVADRQPEGIRPTLAILFISAIWGCTFLFVKRALEEISPILFITLRFGIGTVLLAGAMRGRWWPKGPDRGAAVLAAFITGAILFTGYLLQTAGLRQTSVANAGFLTGLYIPLVPLLGTFVYRSVPRITEVGGVVIASAGTVLMTLPEKSDLASGIQVNRGDLLVIAATFAWAFQIIVLGRYSQRYPASLLAVGQIGTCALLGSLTFWWWETPRVVWSASVITGILFSACAATALAFALQSWAQKHVPANRTALLFATEPLFAWGASFAVTGERLGGRAMIGAALILASVLLVELKPKAPSGHPSA